jgi:hypothetical protein
LNIGTALLKNELSWQSRGRDIFYRFEFACELGFFGNKTPHKFWPLLALAHFINALIDVNFDCKVEKDTDKYSH